MEGVPVHVLIHTLSSFDEMRRTAVAMLSQGAADATVVVPAGSRLRPPDPCGVVDRAGLPELLSSWKGAVVASMPGLSYSIPQDFLGVLSGACREGVCSCLRGTRVVSSEKSGRALVDRFRRMPYDRRMASGDSSEEQVGTIDDGSAWAVSADALSRSPDAAIDFREMTRLALSSGTRIVVANPPDTWFSGPRSPGSVSRTMYIPRESGAVIHAYRADPPSVPAERYEGKRDPFIVSLTSIPDRIANVHLVVRSLLDQEVPAEKVVLYLSDSQFPGGDGDLPEDLLSLKGDRFEIRYDRGDIRSYKKLIPLMDPSQFPGMDVVTADDDMVYGRGFTRELSDCRMLNPGVIAGRYFHLMHVVSGSFRHGRATGFSRARSRYLKMGTGAGMYIPHGVLDGTDIGDRRMFMTSMPTHDELWLWLMGFAAGVPFMCTGTVSQWGGLSASDLKYSSGLHSLQPGLILGYTQFATSYCRYAGVDVRDPSDPLWPVVSDQKSRVW